MKTENKPLVLFLGIMLCVQTLYGWKVEKDGTTQMKLTDTGRLWIGADGKYGEPKMAVTTTESSEDRALDVRTERGSGNNYGIVATAYGENADMNVALYGWASRAANNYGLYVDSGYGYFRSRVGIGTQSPASMLHIIGSVDHEDGTIVTIQNDTSVDWSRALSVLTPNVPNGKRAGLLTFGQADSEGAAGHISYVNSDTDGEGYIDFAIRSKGANFLTIREDGIVGIATATKQSSGNDFKLYVNGKAKAKKWEESSDRRLKKEIETIKNPLEKVERLRGVTFRWKDDNSSRREIGFIAQEVEKIVPEVVTPPTKNDKFYSMSYGELTALLTEAIKELKKQNDALKKIVCKDHPEEQICLQTDSDE